MVRVLRIVQDDRPRQREHDQRQRQRAQRCVPAIDGPRPTPAKTTATVIETLPESPHEEPEEMPVVPLSRAEEAGRGRRRAVGGLAAAAVLVAADRVSEARAVVTIAAPSDTDHLRETLLTRAPGIETSGRALVSIGGREFPIRRRFLEDLEQHRLTDALGSLSPALLVFHSPTDAVVDVGHAERICSAARSPPA